jgi:hypothetical protein
MEYFRITGEKVRRLISLSVRQNYIWEHEICRGRLQTCYFCPFIDICYKGEWDDVEG